MRTYYIPNILILLIPVVWACSDDEAPEPDLVVGFENTSYALDLEQTQETVVIEFSRAASTDLQLTVSVTEAGGMTYGQDQDYTTSPVVNNSQLLLNAPAGNTEVSFQLTKHRNPEFEDTKSVDFEVISVSSGGQVGVNSTAKIEFAENPVSSGATLDPEVGGESQPNQVFIDLSKQESTAIARPVWDLGFFTGEEFRVTLNSSVGMLARPLQKTDMTAVTAADTLGFGAQLDLDAIFGALFGAPPSWLGEAAGWADNPDGDLTKTAIAEVSDDYNQNPVYIINRGKNPDDTPRGWLKIRILKNGSGYDLQHAAIDATTFETVTIAKNEALNFDYLNFEDGLVSVEPEKDGWDIAFTTITEQLAVGPGTTIPYFFKDYVIQNRNGVEVAMVDIEGGTTYEGFSAEDILSVTFDPSQNAIGSDWRTVASPTPGTVTGVVDDVFYVVKDPDQNYYKLRFTRMLDPETGERGHPQVAYQLL